MRQRIPNPRGQPSFSSGPYQFEQSNGGPPLLPLPPLLLLLLVIPARAWSGRRLESLPELLLPPLVLQ